MRLIAAGVVGIGTWPADAAPRRPGRKPAPHAPAPAAPAARPPPEPEQLKAQYEAAEARQASFAAARIARKGVALPVRTTGPDSTDTEVWRRALINALIGTGDSAGSMGRARGAQDVSDTRWPTRGAVR